MTTHPISAQGKDGLVTFDGQTLSIQRKALPTFLGGLLRSSFRSARIRLDIAQITAVNIGKTRIVFVAPGAIRRLGKAPKAADVDYPLTVRFPGKARADFEALREAVLVARPALHPSQG